MLWPSLWGFWFALIIPPVQAVQNYQSHYRGSRSIYLMRRLPDRWELHRRCLILPLLELAATLLLLAVLTVGFYFLYRGCAPGGSLPLYWDQGPVYRSFTICSHKRRGQSCLRFPMCASPTAPTPL